MAVRIQKKLDVNFEAQVREAITKAERKTSAEIVPMVVWSSTGTDHVWPLLWLIFAVASIGFFEIVPMDALYPIMPWQFGVLLLGLVSLVSWWLSRCGWIQNALTSDREMIKAVDQRALVEFFESQMDETLSRTGVLLFLSLRERRAVVLADKSISDHLDKKVWQEVIQELISTASKENITQGLVKAIEKCGDLVSTSFPRSPTDVNELPNKLIIKA